MLSPAISYGIAFLSGCLLVLTFMPSIHKRAVRLTTRHIVATAPASVADIRAERDRARAQLAVALRRLEASVEELKTKCASQSAEVGRQAAEIHRLEAELKKRAALISVLRVRGEAQHAVT